MPDAIQASARAIVRPFADCTDLLENGLKCRISAESEYTSTGNFPELPANYDGFAPSLQLSFSAKDASEILGVAPDDLALVAVLGVRSIKLSEAIAQYESGRIVSGAELKLGDSRIRGLPAGTPFTITIALVLRHEKAYKAGSPWLPGHWAGKKAITFNSAPQGRSFNIKSLAADEFPKQFRVPKETFYYVQCSEDDFVDRETFQKNVTVYVREDCYNALLGGGRSPTLDAVFSQMEADIVAQIASKALRNATEATAQEDSVQGALLKRLKKKLKLPIETLKLTAEKEPERFRAMVQAVCDVGPAMSKTAFS